MADGDGTVLIEDAKIVLRNFEGKEDKFNAKGTRSFCVLLDEKLATDPIVELGLLLDDEPVDRSGDCVVIGQCASCQ